MMDDGLPRYVCPQCGVKYKKRSALRAHQKECGRGAQCPLCPKIVTQKRNLPKHIERHAKDDYWGDYYYIAQFADSTLGKQDRNSVNQFTCRKCGRSYSSRSIMLRHMNHECGVEKKIFCNICHRRFRRKWNLKQHIKRLHPNQPFRCRYCGKGYMVNSSLRRHQKYDCPMTRFAEMLYCPYCSYSNRRRDKINVHLRTHYEHGRDGGMPQFEGHLGI
ncbi:Zinc finger C2H2 superfamily [Sergentomyia squamirostris]